jgi:CopG family transcriptional regulator/antitoxin EndoAI
MKTRINITLPEETLGLLDRVAERGNRSRLISEAVLHYVRSKAKLSLRERLKQGALARAERDLAVAEEWFTVDDQAWTRKPTAGRKR